MIISRGLFFTAAFLISSAAAALVYAAPDSERSCYLQAPAQDDVYVTVYNADGDGNWTDMIWRGTIPAGQEKLLTSKYGRIRYEFSFSSDQPAEGGDFSLCTGMNSIGVMP